MSTIQVQIPDSLQKSLDDLAARDGISIDQFISTAIAEKLSALMTENYLIEKAKKGSREKYEAILTKVPDVEPEAYDRLPTV
ncbi:MAG: toxin-antitoxin system HicB family antitoxin [Microcystis viridis Mv_BB_P_19951000_S69]|jgi:metal-responsive CopG/Arc/MetJ family transcriptional regulator|uniref:Toxin-antitoxin system HicB family antitoxin n=1 Tax=Microcystis viridis Mv_BB_P_19951000_S68D TaxID=2486270 RepID=A0A552HAL7_MICVR|nr:toxin-antitoxin system HicB family antitoxin [Microcystis sp. LSC13-02]NCR59250.1 toxin-antitoxin system HicB family antitoxin [Microcystis aeruginosa LL13-06]TRU68284.1 MAG: toxin-antitoxin system HicB family antitoxin [Microcystis viridis Mv_BB_P_19951000_S68D]TRU72027.1 MAG: toxin-antitoxin system HicB family antitoxin [Microcystis viridis Mv_BB_P_19951000_S69]TRU77012.1 MAG: toxin-antitoxin system HicB family antitoxin [Microcystis viridis Mv_BB_P_19951000_S68]TRU83758.1 MAG: toxin-anti